MSNFNLTNWFRNEYSGRSLSEALIQNVNNLNGTLRHYIDKGDVYLQFIPTEKTLDDFGGDKEKITKVLVDTLSKVSIIGKNLETPYSTEAAGIVLRVNLNNIVRDIADSIKSLNEDEAEAFAKKYNIDSVEAENLDDIEAEIKKALALYKNVKGNPSKEKEVIQSLKDLNKVKKEIESKVLASKEKMVKKSSPTSDEL